jgi:hypothetical protein
MMKKAQTRSHTKITIENFQLGCVNILFNFFFLITWTSFANRCWYLLLLRKAEDADKGWQNLFD